MELTEIARGHIVLKSDGKTITIYGEALLRGYGSPDYILYLNSINQWKFADCSIKVTDEERAEIVVFLKSYFEKRNIAIAIE